MQEVKKWFTHTIKLFIPVILLSATNCLMVIATWFELALTGSIQTMLTPMYVLGIANIILGISFLSCISVMIYKFSKTK